MPLTVPAIDGRSYQALLDEALARIPVHNPEWTNFNDSDPGVTLVQLFAFMTENLLYRANQIPERNRRKFLSLLGVPLQAAASAQGLVTFTNERGPLQTLTLNAGLEVRAGQAPFRTRAGLDVLPVEARPFLKRKLEDPPADVVEYYQHLYASYRPSPSTRLLLYETMPLPAAGSPAFPDGVDLGRDTVDGSLWIALFMRDADRPYDAENKLRVRRALAGKTVSLGVVPSLADASVLLSPAGRPTAEGEPLLQYQVPRGRTLQRNGLEPAPEYVSLEARTTTDVLSEPGVVQLTLPSEGELGAWEDDLDPLEPGVGDLPPTLEDTNLSERLITWLRVRLPATQLGRDRSSLVRARLRWVGINTVQVSQRAHVSGELLPAGTGEPDQSVFLRRTPVIPASVRLTVSAGDDETQWAEVDDLLSAGSEVRVLDAKLPPGAPAPQERPSRVFTVDAESGEIRFGDGLRGARPPAGAVIRADYDYGVGRDGNVGPGAINSAPSLPAGMRVSNPVRTWGGDEGETVADGEKQVARYLQHRDRLVTLEDFETITRRAPGVDIGRVEALPAYNPELAPNEPGDAPGAVTIMVIPKHDPIQPDAPLPDRLFLDTICDYINPRRLVTTEVYLRPPVYKPIWISVGINVVAGDAVSVAEVREVVRRELAAFLSPLPGAASERGWPLRKPVVALELWAVASRVRGVSLVNGVLLAEGQNAPAPQVAMAGLELPRVAGISVSPGDPVPLELLRNQVLDVGSLDPTNDPSEQVRVVPVPVVPQECM
jgi:hypothetical protein